MTAPRTLICGSLAYDTIMVFRDRFSRHILPDKAQMLSVSFTVGDMRREWGGCAGNIAYNLKALGGDPVVMATVGDDGAPYRERLASLAIAADGVRHVPGTFTAQAYIITDLDDNQITAFHPGAMQLAHATSVPAGKGIELAIIAPDGRDAMLQNARQLHELGIPFVFDPGQQLPMFDGDTLRHLVGQATWVALNDYEAKMLCDRMGTTLQALSDSHLRGVVVTLGAQGCEVWQRGLRTVVPGVAAVRVVDPTGCGDALRGALLYGLQQGWSLERCAALGNRAGALKIAHRGGQNHPLGPELLASR